MTFRLLLALLLLANFTPSQASALTPQNPRVIVCEWLLKGPFGKSLSTALGRQKFEFSHVPLWLATLDHLSPREREERVKIVEGQLTAGLARGAEDAWLALLEYLRYLERTGQVARAAKWTTAASLRVHPERLTQAQRNVFIGILKMFGGEPSLPISRVIEMHYRSLSGRLESGEAGFEDIYPQGTSPFADLQFLKYLPETPEFAATYVSLLMASANVFDLTGFAGDREWKSKRRANQRLLDFAAELGASADYAFAAQAAQWHTVVGLIEAKPLAALPYLLRLKASPSVAEAFSRFAAKVPASRLDPATLNAFSERWRRVIILSATWISESRGGEEPTIDGRYLPWDPDAGKALRLGKPGVSASVPEPATPRNLFFFAEQEMRRASYLATAGEEGAAAADKIIESLSSSGRAVANAHVLWRNQEPFTSAGVSLDAADRPTSFVPLDFKVNAYLNLAGLLPERRWEWTQTAYRLSRRALGEVTLYGMAVRLRLAGVMLELGEVDSSQRLQREVANWMRDLRPIYDKSVGRNADLDALDEYLKWHLGALTALRLGRHAFDLWEEATWARLDADAAPVVESVRAPRIRALRAGAAALYHTAPELAGLMARIAAREAARDLGGGSARAWLADDLPRELVDAGARFLLLRLHPDSALGRTFPFLLDCYLRSDLAQTHKEATRQFNLLLLRDGGRAESIYLRDIMHALHDRF